MTFQDKTKPLLAIWVGPWDGLTNQPLLSAKFCHFLPLVGHTTGIDPSIAGVVRLPFKKSRCKNRGLPHHPPCAGQARANLVPGGVGKDGLSQYEIEPAAERAQIEITIMTEHRPFGALDVMAQLALDSFLYEPHLRFNRIIMLR